MWQLTLAFIDIAFHRRGPEHLPASQYLLGVVLLVYVVIGVLVVMLRAPFLEALHLVLIQTLVYLGFTWVLLKFFERAQRFEQTVMALVGTSTLLAVPSAPVILWMQTSDPEPLGATLLALGLLVWSIDIGAHVLSRALDQPYIVAAMIMVVYVAAAMALRMIFYPPAV